MAETPESPSSSSSEDEEDEMDRNVVREGYIKKQGGFFKNWQTRWFVLGEDQTLTYFETRRKHKQKGKIDLKYVTEVAYAERPTNGIFIYCKKPKRTYVLQLKTHEKRDRWLKAIKAIAEGRRLRSKNKLKKSHSLPKKQKYIKQQPVVVQRMLTPQPMSQPAVIQQYYFQQHIPHQHSRSAPFITSPPSHQMQRAPPMFASASAPPAPGAIGGSIVPDHARAEGELPPGQRTTGGYNHSITY